MDRNIDSLRHDLGLLRGWILHWQDDTASRLPITNESMAHALMVIERAKGSLERVEAEHIAPAARAKVAFLKSLLPQE